MVNTKSGENSLMRKFIFFQSPLHKGAIIQHDNGMNIWIKEIRNYNMEYKFINLAIHAPVYMYSGSNDRELRGCRMNKGSFYASVTRSFDFLSAETDATHLHH